MSAITIENDLVHYEVLGRGRPVIFVHGWLGSWRYWVPTMQQLSMKYRTYALDLWGFGDSGKQINRYGFQDQVRLLYDFMEKLGIGKAALVGHSLGAAICLRFASQYPDRAPRVMLVSPPLFDLGGLTDVPASAPAPAIPAAPVSISTAPASATTPATTTPAQAVPAAPADAKPAPAPASSTATPVPATTPAATPAGSAAATTPAQAIPAAPAEVKPVPAAPDGSAANPIEDATLPRNPLRALGNTPEEILANIQARNISGSAGTTGSGVEPLARPLPPAAPSLPINIGTPILPKPSSLMPPVSPPNMTAPAPLPPAPAQPEVPNPLISLLSGIKPGALLIKHVDRDAPDLDKLRAEVEKTDETALSRSAQSFTGVNLALELHQLTSPTLLLHGQDDPLIPPPNGTLIQKISQGKPDGHLLAFIEPDLRHFPMLEITAKFNRLLIDFLDAQDLTNVQFKDQWIRIFR